jgi:hypothetical protein
MRSIKLVPALAAIAAATLALAPAGASAARHHALKHAAKRHGSSGCRLSLNAAPRYVQAGESAEIFGRLTCAGGVSVAAQTVTVLERSLGAPSVTTATATTDEHGAYELTTPALQTNSEFTASAAGAQSGHRRVTVAPKVDLSTPPTPAEGSQLFTGVGQALGLHHRRLAHVQNLVRFSGTVSAEEQDAEVVLQRENAIRGEDWHRIDSGRVQAGGGFSIPHVFRVPGDANIRVVVRPFGFNGRGASDTRSYEISQAQNPLLTIQSSANPISYKQSTGISGTLGAGTASAVAGTPLTLLTRTRLQRNFVQVAQGVTSAGGSYEFAAQKPLQSTFYRVSGAGKLSAVLFEGVKYVLTAAASASSAQVGQPVTFSGTVTPWRVGHVVYLQAQDASGLGFHVIQVATVEPPATPGGPATFSIPHAFYNAARGPRKVRVKVPGDPEDQGSASQVFEIALTPAPTLKPEAPGNSSLPAPGQL